MIFSGVVQNIETGNQLEWARSKATIESRFNS